MILQQEKTLIGNVKISSQFVTNRDENKINILVGITGTKKGFITICFKVGNQQSGNVSIQVKDSSSSSSSSSSGKSNSGSSNKKSSTVLVDTNILRDDFANEFDPNSKVGGFDVSEPFIKVIIPVVNRVLSILQIIGAIVLVLSIALAGFNGVIGAGDGFAEDLGLNISSSYNEYGNKVEGVQNLTQGSLSKIIRRALIGSLILESSLMIVRIVFAICTNL